MTRELISTITTNIDFGKTRELNYKLYRVVLNDGRKYFEVRYQYMDYTGTRRTSKERFTSRFDAKKEMVFKAYAL